MKLNKTILWAAGGFLTLAFVGIFAAPKVSAAIRGAFVEVVIPSKPFFGTLTTNFFQPSTGPDTGTLGVTSLTVTNFDPTAHLISINAPVFSSGSCSTQSSEILGPAAPNLLIYAQPLATQTITFPTPLVFAGVQGHTCVGILGPGSIQVYVTGFVN
jgi:hypothetical protein